MKEQTICKQLLIFDFLVSPWEATLGANVTAPTPEGPVQLSAPAGSSQGRKMRLEGKGLPGQPPGDLYAVLTIALPPAASEPQRAACQARVQSFAVSPMQFRKKQFRCESRFGNYEVPGLTPTRGRDTARAGERRRSSVAGSAARSGAVGPHGQDRRTDEAPIGMREVPLLDETVVSRPHPGMGLGPTLVG